MLLSLPWLGLLGLGLGLVAVIVVVVSRLSERRARAERDDQVALRRTLSEELKANRQELQAQLWQTAHALEGKVGALEGKLDQRLREVSQGVQGKLDANLKEGFRHYEKVQEHLKQAQQELQSLNTVGQSIHELNSLLKMPHLRGNFGEAMLEQLLSDLLPRDAFELQYRIVPNSTERVDAVIKSPQGILPIDSKFPREQVLPLFEAKGEEELETARRQLNDVVRQLARDIRSKYIHPEHGTLDMALIFLPSETLYFEVLRDVRLTDELSRQRVFPVSPQTLAVTLHAISLSRQYYEMARGVEHTLTEIKKAQQHFAHFERRFEEIGNCLGRAHTSYHTAHTHLARYRGAVSRLTGTEPSTLEPVTEAAAAPPAGGTGPAQGTRVDAAR